ncbi:MAG: F0F1 ATP synthase subunit gamma [Bacteroidales bacterium]|nr:F0F1 ATP synthase subunit gamma [Bacteroidales bacterium]
MASLREIKDHIGSVRSTLKITSAMKLVSSAKLRKAQQAAEGVRPYTAALAAMLANVLEGSEGIASDPVRGSAAHPSQPAGWAPPSNNAEGGMPLGGNAFAASTVIPSASTVIPSEAKGSRVAIVAVASNSSLCGAFNVNVVRRVLDEVEVLRKEGTEVEVFSVGRKMAEAMRKAGLPSRADYSDLVGHNSFEKSAAFAQTLIDAYNSGRYSRILFIYNHFVTTSSQKVTVEQYLPFSVAGGCPIGSGMTKDVIAGSDRQSPDTEYILEPSREEILATLLPQVMRLRVHTVLLDSIAAEHAARTIAMQTASDNAEDLLGELTLEYNKGRQQKITSEILDLVGGAQQ